VFINAQRLPLLVDDGDLLTSFLSLQPTYHPLMNKTSIDQQCRPQTDFDSYSELYYFHLTVKPTIVAVQTWPDYKEDTL
jgi:hypothetical protein